MKYTYNTFKELFNEIHYAYEDQYGCEVYKGQNNTIEVITFHKLTLFDNGTINYKGQVETFDPRLWRYVVALAKMLQETKAEKILYGKK